MPQFRYTGRDELGNSQSGVLEANSLEEAKQAAFERVHWLTEIAPVGSADKTALSGFSLTSVLAPVRAISPTTLLHAESCL